MRNITLTNTLRSAILYKGMSTISRCCSFAVILNSGVMRQNIKKRADIRKPITQQYS